MQLRNFLLSVFVALTLVVSITSCRKTIELGKQPLIEFVSGTDLITTDSTLKPDKLYYIRTRIERSEDLSPNTTFEIVRTYSTGLDTTVFFINLKDADQTVYENLHNFTTLNKAGTERFTFTVKNSQGIVNQKILVMTVK